MRKYRFFCKQPLAVEQELMLDEPIAHHIARVLRLEAGASIHLFNNTGLEFGAQIMHTTKNAVKVVITTAIEAKTESLLDLHLGLALIKFDKLDLILQKACELGVSKISLINMQHSSIKSGYQRACDKLEHWHKIIESAAAQCWRSNVPTLAIVENLEKFLAVDDQATLKLILDPRATQNYQFKPQVQHQAVTTLIGPEGGFSEQEIELVRANQYASMMLGPRILRTETACFCALTLMQANYGDLIC